MWAWIKLSDFGFSCFDIAIIQLLQRKKKRAGNPRRSSHSSYLLTMLSMAHHEQTLLQSVCAHLIFLAKLHQHATSYQHRLEVACYATYSRIPSEHTQSIEEDLVFVRLSSSPPSATKMATVKLWKKSMQINQYLDLRNFAAKYFNGFNSPIEQEIQWYELQVRKITVSGADFWSFEASWRSSEASEVTTYDTK